MIAVNGETSAQSTFEKQYGKLTLGIIEPGSSSTTVRESLANVACSSDYVAVIVI